MRKQAKSAAPTTARPQLNADLMRDLFAITRSPSFLKYLRNLLVNLCRIETTPNPDIAIMRRAESQCFDILERELRAIDGASLTLERRPVNPEIAAHPSFSLLHFTKTSKRPDGLAPGQAYAGRSNLICVLPGLNQAGKGQSLALNGHIDVVAPYFPPRVKGGTVFGRGACDDKGPVVSIVGALHVVSRLLKQRKTVLNRNVVGMFVVEEETGGNGSLSIATDARLKQLYDTVLVAECTGLKVYPANRGAVWYKAVIRPPKGLSAFEMFAFINEEMEKEGTAIRAESFHPLFPQRPVQTCHGMIGTFGEHPSRICGEVGFQIKFERPPDERGLQLLRDCLEAGLSSYIGQYGDKTKGIDPATGKPMVARHFDLKPERSSVTIRVHGATGHMGAIRERDGAITKMAYLVRSILRSRRKLEEQTGGPVALQLEGTAADDPLVLEGGQGFVPTHQINEVMERQRQAVWRGAETWMRQIHCQLPGKDVVTVTYEKLHNVAFDGDPASPSMLNALAAAQLCGLPAQEPVLGWTVSCDARLFATEYPGMQVLTFGPGALVHAHSDAEQIEMEDVRKAVEFLAAFILLQTDSR